jgi:glycerol-3-phosphate dehydrogenase (NAD(P)+)
MSELLRAAVLGAGNWGTTLGHLIASNGHDTRLWTRDPAQRDEINQRHTNEQGIRGLKLCPQLRAETDLSAAIEQADLIVMVIPSQAFRAVCRQLMPVVSPRSMILHGTKGLEANSHRRMSEILCEETCVRQLGVVAGPNIAAEIARGKPAGSVVATRFPRLFALGKMALSSAQLRVFESDDVCGVELCGALKNVVAIAAGIADEMAMGDNAKAFLITRGMTEIMRLAFAMGASPATTAGLAGIGDLMVTCASPLSRNHRLGVALARGMRLEEATDSIGMVAEGVYASRSARALAQVHGVEMTLFEHIDRVLHDGVPPAEALALLMGLPTGRDVPGVMRSQARAR